MFSKDNEVYTWKYITDLANASLVRYPTTINEDRKILENEKMCSQIR